MSKKNTRQQLIDVATELFMTNGYLATSTRQIANLVGITQPNLYNHFANKEALYLAILEELSGAVRGSLKLILADATLTAEEQLKQMASELKQKHQFDFHVMMHDVESVLSPALQRQLFDIYQRSYYQPFFDFFSQEKQLLQKSMTPELAVRHFLVTIGPYIKKEKDELFSIDQFVDLFLHGVWK